ncbi:MAG: TonB family protein [Woeseiaceae bacterium]
MRLEQFKTQVLLLHSEQSTLDSLSSGFNDRYTVHCATSGSEALNFLGDTPIHVIISAQDLPGMSGAEALREAKKRSPDTIGILLAGPNADNTQAIVGEKEVFDVVRGKVNPGDLLQMIDNATQKMRLMALAESANDTQADVDEPVSEHIVLETSENGSSIVSDGTGQFPAVDPKRVSESANTGARAVDVLVMTKDEEFLATVRESARGLNNIIHTNTLAQADDAVKNRNVGVAVIDAAMVGSNVEKLTLHLRKTKQRLVSIVAGRRDDGEMLMDLINRGKVYRFLLKPVSPGRARLAIEASIKHHLEAPDAAFKTVPGAAAPAKAASRPAPAAAPAPAPQPVVKKTAATYAAAAPSFGESPVQDGLSDAFGDDDSSFTETMTGIVTSVGKSIGGIKDSLSRKKDAAPVSAKKEPRINPAAIRATPPAPAPARASGPAPAPAGAPARAAAQIPAPVSNLDLDDGGSSFATPKIIGAIAVVLIAVAAVGWWAMSGSNDPASSGNTQVASDSASGRNAGQGNATRSAAELFAEARLARDAGQVFNPTGGNAIELLLAATQAEPGNAEIAAELDAVLDQALEMAEAAMLEKRIADASAALRRVASANPDHSRLSFLNAQLAQMQLRTYLDDARVAMRDSRFDDAMAAISAARGLNVPDRSAIETVAAELSAARVQQKVDDVLATAAQRIEEGRLIEPANDNARYYYDLVLGNDPDNAAARAGLTAVASKLVLNARAEMDDGNFDDAGTILMDAKRVDPESVEVAAAIDALKAERRSGSDARDNRATQQREAAEKRAADRVAAEQKAAEQKAAKERAAQQQAAQQQAARDQAAQEQAARDQAAQEQAAAAKQQQAAPIATPVAAATAAVENAEAAQPQAEQIVPVGSLNRTKYVAPKYPRSAERRGISGWVDMIFTVNAEGRVEDISVRDSDPGDTFVTAAEKAVEKWEFEPIVENGSPVPKRAAVRLMFAIE